jgi:peptide/nickel transport system substrate-binding protein
MAEAGQTDFEFELISYDADYVEKSADVVAEQCREAGFRVKRTVIPSDSFWTDWTKYPWSTTQWGMRPLGVQILALAYRSGVPWNETGYTNEDFDRKLSVALSIADADRRSEAMKDIEFILQDSGIIIQPFWRSVYRHHVPGIWAPMHPTLQHHHSEWSLTSGGETCSSACATDLQCCNGTCKLICP